MVDQAYEPRLKSEYRARIRAAMNGYHPNPRRSASLLIDKSL